jgi:CyaY protein
VTEAEFDALALPELSALVRALDALDAAGIQPELQGDVLSLEFEDGTKFVINSHRAARQIWMAAERSAWHFDFMTDGARWVARKSGDELWSTLARVLSNKLSQSVILSPAASAG